jgi:predicted metalloprotease with PDZ domain
VNVRLLAALALVLVGLPALAIGQPRMRLDVDAREAPRRILHARLNIAVTPGPLTLYYPKWLPGNHAPTGPIADLVGIRMSTGGQAVTWQRDSVDLYALKLVIPAGASNLDVSLDFLSGLPDGNFASPASLTTELAMIRWNQLVLYPSTSRPDELDVEASIRLPAGWDFATALTRRGSPEDGSDSPVTFEPVSLGTLVDSTLLAGRHLRRIVLDDSRRPVSLVVAADSPEALKVTPETEASLRRLVREADALFGARHFRRYVFLVAVSDLVAHFGLESHESSENRLPENSFTNPAVGMLVLAVLPHEYVHSWNGKYRRPDGLATPDFQAPMQGDLLWVYEGLTQYLGHVLATRSGLWTAERYRDRLAHVVAYYSQQPGRRWRALADTAISSQQLVRASPLWRSYRRSADYYSEGALAWLEADMLIRAESRGKRSLDDFCRAFFGGKDYSANSAPTVSPYAEGDIYAALQAVLPHDWQRFFAERIYATNPPAPVAGMEQGGWSLTFRPTRNPFLQDIESYDPSRLIDLGYSLGLRLTGDGLIDDLFLDSPASEAGLAPGMQLRAVNGRRWTASRLRDAIAAAQNDGSGRLKLLVENGDRFDTVELRYSEGLREPRLERLPSTPDRLGASIAPRTR